MTARGARGASGLPRPLLSPVALSPHLDALTRQGAHGGVIPLHRAFLRVTMNGTQVALSVASPLILAAAWIYFGPVESAAWAVVMEFSRKALGMPGQTMVLVTNLGPIPEVRIPFFVIPASPPSSLTLFWTAVLTVVIAAVSLLGRDRLLPVAYLLRVVAFVQATAVVFFFFWPSSFPYGIDDYTIAEMIAGYGTVALTPLMFGLIFNIFDFSIFRKVALAALAMLHLAILIPFQFVIHAWIIHRFSLLFMPTLFMLGGLLLEVTVVVAFYGWGMSWRGTRKAARNPRA